MPVDEQFLCVRCKKPVIAYRPDYEVFEQMHWSCFHYEFEHGDRDPDLACGDPSCPARAFDPKPPPTWAAMEARTAVFKSASPKHNDSIIYAAVHVTARRESGPPPPHAFRVARSIWMALDFEPPGVYPNESFAEEDFHWLAEGARRAAHRVPLNDESPNYVGIVVTRLMYLDVDLFPEAIRMAMACWITDEFGLERPDFEWRWNRKTKRHELHSEY